MSSEIGEREWSMMTDRHGLEFLLYHLLIIRLLASKRPQALLVQSVDEG